MIDLFISLKVAFLINNKAVVSLRMRHKNVKIPEHVWIKWTYLFFSDGFMRQRKTVGGSISDKGASSFQS